MGPEPSIAPSARKHGVTDEAMLHAYAHPIDVFELDEGLTMLIGGDESGTLLEIGVVHRFVGPLIVHAMRARRRFIRGDHAT